MELNSSSGSSPVQILKEDHARIKELFQAFEESREIETKKEIFLAVAYELKIHSAIEEEIFYPAAREVLPREDLLNEAVQEHHVVDLIMDEIANMYPTDALGAEEFIAKFTVLQENVEHHIEEEEEEIFPEFENSELNQLVIANQMMERRQILEGRGKAA
jgi:hypothetical protein